MIYDLPIPFSFIFMTAPLEMVAINDFLIDTTKNDKICDLIGQLRFLCKLIGCEAQEGAE